MSVIGVAEDAVAVAVPQTRLVKPIAVGVLAVLILISIGFAVWAIFLRPAAARQQAATAKVEAATGQATAGAAQSAVQVITQHGRTIERTNTITEGGVRAVQSAIDAGTPVPAVAAAVRNSVCLLDTYAGDPGCAALRGAGEGVGAAGQDAGGAAPTR